jgi:hypothetical protein
VSSRARRRPIGSRSREVARPFAAIEEIERWDALSRAERLVVAVDLCAALGPSFAPSRSLFGARRLAAVIHRPTRLSFVVVPGGELRMGITDEELAQIVDWGQEEAPGDAGVCEDLRAQASCSRPVHEVIVHPFLCARAPLLEGLAKKTVETWDTGANRALLDDSDQKQSAKPAQLTRGESARAAERLGFRILCEAEWEWIAREGGRTSWVCQDLSSPDWRPYRAADGLAAMEAFAAGSTDPEVVNGFGVWGLLWGEWAADAFHADYEGAPAIARGWGAGSEPEMLRAFGAATFWPWQNPREFIACHAGYRTWTSDRAQAASVRLALDVPGFETG